MAIKLRTAAAIAAFMMIATPAMATELDPCVMQAARAVRNQLPAKLLRDGLRRPDVLDAYIVALKHELVRRGCDPRTWQSQR